MSKPWISWIAFGLIVHVRGRDWVVLRADSPQTLRLRPLSGGEEEITSIHLGLVEIRRVLEKVPEPTRSLLILIVFASMRPGEAMALRWKDCLPDRIVVDERAYDNEFDEVKTEAGEREVPLDRHGVILGALQVMWERNQKFPKLDDLVFANQKGKPLDRHNLRHRHLKPVVKELGLPRDVDFRSFRTMHASLMRRMGGRLEVARDNMGHAGGTGSITLDVYLKTWTNAWMQLLAWLKPFSPRLIRRRNHPLRRPRTSADATQATTGYPLGYPKHSRTFGISASC